MKWLGPIEGGWWPGGPSDPNPTMRGVTQRVYDPWRTERHLPIQSVRKISDDEVEEIYHHDYWNTAGCDRLPWPLSLIVFDTAVNSGVGNAKKLLARTSDPTTYLDLRLAFYERICVLHPNLAPNLPNWRSRVRKLRKESGL